MASPSIRRASVCEHWAMTSGEWSGRRAQVALERVRAKGMRNAEPCCLCMQPIDYTLRLPDPMSCSVQHLKSRATHPHLTWDSLNWGPAHLVCNQRAGTGDALDIGDVSW